MKIELIQKIRERVRYYYKYKDLTINDMFCCVLFDLYPMEKPDVVDLFQIVSDEYITLFEKDFRFN